jgi:hypothetical protein
LWQDPGIWRTAVRLALTHMKGTEDQQILYQLLSSWRNTPNKLKKNFGTNSLRFANPLL